MNCTICESPLVYPHVTEIAGQIVEACDNCYEQIAEAHSDCDDEYCRHCQAEARRREAKRYTDAQVAYYATGGFFDLIFDGAFREEGLRS